MSPKEELIQELIAAGHLKSPRIIDALQKIDRANFVLPENRAQAYGNFPIPIGEGQTISQPLTVSFLLELLDPQPGEKILDVGSGSGWTAALLTHIVNQKRESVPRPSTGIPAAESGLGRSGNQESGKVFGIERISEICKFGKKNLAKYFDESRAKIICADGTLGLPEEAPFDKILAGAAAAKEIPPAWKEQLKTGGKIVAPVGESIVRLTKRSETEWNEEKFPGFVFVPLVSGTEEEKNGDKETAQKESARRSRFNRTACFLLFASVLLLASAVFANELFRPHAAYLEAKEIEISPGMGSRKIGELLKSQGIIRSKWVFVAYVSLRGAASSLKPGKYVFGRLAISEIAKELVRGDNYEITITIPEGWTAREIAIALHNRGIPDGKLLEPLAPDTAMQANFPFLAEVPAKNGLEGYLFPDTYRFFKDAKARDLAQKMLENFAKKVTLEMRQEILKQERNLFAVVAMASLIEEEVRSDEDRALVSGILWKRLQAGIPLQVDATVIYAKNKKDQTNTLSVRGHTPLSRSDLAIDSPYNTYKYPGLPQGPIANPGLSALKAAIYPKISPYLYYLSTRDGRTIFSRTLEEHNEAKIKYLR